MQPNQQSVLLIFALILAYVWAKVSWFQPYALQAVALCLLAYIAIKRYNRAKLWHVLPKHGSVEMALVTFALMLAIGSSGNLSSPLAPLAYIHLFFLVMSTSLNTAITVGLATTLFHFALTPTFGWMEISTLLTIPMMLVFFLFAKQQHEEVLVDRQLIEKNEELIENSKKEKFRLTQEIARLKQTLAQHQAKKNLYHGLLVNSVRTMVIWRDRFFGSDPHIQKQISSLVDAIEPNLSISRAEQQSVQNTQSEPVMNKNKPVIESQSSGVILAQQ